MKVSDRDRLIQDHNSVPGLLKDDNNTGAAAGGVVAGGVVAGVLGLVIIVLVVLFLLYRNDRLSVCRDKNKSDSHGIAFSNMGTENNARSLGTSANPTDALDKNRTGSSQYESLGPQRESSEPYEGLQTDSNSTYEQTSSGNVYDELNPGKGAVHLYLMMQGGTESTNTRHATYQTIRIDKNYNASDMKPSGNNAGASRDGVSSEGNTQVCIYSNLKLSSE